VRGKSNKIKFTFVFVTLKDHQQQQTFRVFIKIRGTDDIFLSLKTNFLLFSLPSTI
jgi:hypothetical protein